MNGRRFAPTGQFGRTLFALTARFLRYSSLARDRQFIDRELVDLATFLDERREPSRSSTAARPGFSAGSARFLRYSSLARDRQFIDRELVDLATFLDERREPSRSSTAARPGFSAGSA